MIHLREYTVWDFEVVCQVHDRARPQELAAGGVNPQAFRPMAEVAGRDEFFVSATLLACVDDVVAGFVSWNGGYITWLYVDPGFQRLGVGRRLLDEALRHIGKEAWTNMIAGNEAALALYTQAGLQVVLTRPGECEGHPCRSMRLALPTSLMSDPAVRRS